MTVTFCFMVFSGVRVTRPAGRVSWRALDGRAVAGEAHAMLRPDGRWYVAADVWIPEAFDALTTAMTGDLRHDLYTTVDSDDEAGQRDWAKAGFTVWRREHHYLIPTAGGQGQKATLPAGMSLVSADAVDEDGLRLLDDELRQDVPGSDGWVNDPREFREQTFSERHFDPATYLVAVDDANQAYAGLARVWHNPGRPRLGLVGVTRSYRRRGLATVLLAAVFAPLTERGIEQVHAEADAANTPSTALLATFGARRAGGSVDLVRRARE